MTHLQLPIHIDATMRSCFVSCPQKFKLEFIHGYRLPGVSLDLHAGACFSSAVEETRKQIWLNGKSLSDALVVAEARFFQEWGDVEPPEWKRTAKTKDRVWEAVESYFTQYPPLTDHIRPYLAADGRTDTRIYFRNSLRAMPRLRLSRRLLPNASWRRSIHLLRQVRSARRLSKSPLCSRRQNYRIKYRPQLGFNVGLTSAVLGLQMGVSAMWHRRPGSCSARHRNPKGTDRSRRSHKALPR